MRMIVPEARRIVAMVTLMALLLAPGASWAHGMTVRINEVMASNGSTIADEDGDYADWIELWNYGAEPVNMSGWGLSDNAGNLGKWQLPAGTVLAGGEYLVIWASGKDRHGSDGLHTNFAIAAGGEALWLTDGAGTLRDYLPATALPRDISIGRYGDDPTTWYYFAEPTPWLTNTSTPYAGILNPPVFSHQGGFYTDPIVLQLAEYGNPEGTQIHYSLDGSEPRAVAGNEYYTYKNAYPASPGSTSGPLLVGSTETKRYEAPIGIDDRTAEPNRIATINLEFTAATIGPLEPIKKATVVRARAVREGYLPSPVVTATYFIDPLGANRYQLPVLSLAADEHGLFDYEAGIYVPGAIADAWRDENPTAAWSGGRPANFHQRGPAWERPVSVEVFSDGGDLQMQQNMGLRIHGGWSRAQRHKAKRIYARGGYGNDRIANIFFPHLSARTYPHQPIEQFDTLILRAAGQDYQYNFFRDALLQGMVRHLPLDTQAYQPAIQFLNGEFWGMVNIRERYDAAYFANHYGLAEDQIALMSVPLIPGAHPDVSIGDDTDLSYWISILQYASEQDLGMAEHLDWVAARVDLDSLALYYAVQIYYSNNDWPHNNVVFWRNRSVPPDTMDAAVAEHHPLDGRWRWMMYDLDYGYIDSVHTPALARVVNLQEGTRLVSWVEQSPFNQFFRKLIQESTRFRERFISLLADHLNATFLPQRVLDEVAAIDYPLQPHRQEHNSRWRVDTRVRPAIITFAEQRGDIQRQHLREVFGLPAQHRLFVRFDAERGSIQVNSLTIDDSLPGIAAGRLDANTWQGEYFQSVPVTLSAQPRQGYRFTGWRMATDPTQPTTHHSSATQLAIDLQDDTLLEAVFEPMAVTVRPDAPVAIEMIAGQPFSLPIDDLFDDPHGEIEEFFIAIEESIPVPPHAAVDDDQLVLSATDAGGAKVTLTAMAYSTAVASHSFRLLVHAQAHALAGGAFLFDRWQPFEPAGTYPPNMLFVQSAVTDPNLSAPLWYPYHIPADDAREPIDVSFPYNASARTRINGLGEDGVAFINTGRGRDLGAAVLTLDTRGASDVRVTWTGGTVLPNSRDYAIRLQMRTGPESPWSDVEAGGQPVEYRRNATVGHSERLGPVLLPVEAAEQAALQLRWKYYHISGTSGPRAQLRLDDILVTSGEPVVATRFAEWRLQHFSAAHLSDPAISGPQAMPLNDGVPNLMKYALGLTPWEHVGTEQLSHGALEDEDSRQYLYIRFYRDPALSDVVYVVEASATLGSWPEILYDSAVDGGANNDGNAMIVVDAAPMNPSAQPLRFLRLKVEER